MAEIEAKVVKVLSNDEIVVDRKIRGCNIIRINNVDELLKDLMKKRSLTKQIQENIQIEFSEEMENLKKTGIPRCSKCKKNMVNAVDSITGKVSKYQWKYNCECRKNKNIRLGMLSMG